LSISSWLAARQPYPPAQVRGLLPSLDDEQPLVSTLANAGVEMLTSAGERTGKDRDTAFLLLAADALLTYACEAAAQSPHPQAALREVLNTVGAGF